MRSPTERKLTETELKELGDRLYGFAVHLKRVFEPIIDNFETIAHSLPEEKKPVKDLILLRTNMIRDEAGLLMNELLNLHEFPFLHEALEESAKAYRKSSIKG